MWHLTLVTFQQTSLICLPNMKQIRQAFISEPCGSCFGPLLETQIFGRPLLNTGIFSTIRLSFMPKKRKTYTAFSVKIQETPNFPIFGPFRPHISRTEMLLDPKLYTHSKDHNILFQPNNQQNLFDTFGETVKRLHTFQEMPDKYTRKCSFSPRIRKILGILCEKLSKNSILDPVWPHISRSEIIHYTKLYTCIKYHNSPFQPENQLNSTYTFRESLEKLHLGPVWPRFLRTEFIHYSTLYTYMKYDNNFFQPENQIDSIYTFGETPEKLHFGPRLTPYLENRNHTLHQTLHTYHVP